MSDGKYLMKLFSDKEILTISGFYTLCLTLFLLPFPRSWSLYSLGVFLTFGLLVWIKETGNVKTMAVRKFFMVMPLTAYFILHLVYFLFDTKLQFPEDKLMFLLVPLLGFPIFASEYLKKHLRFLFLSFLAGIICISIFQILRVTFESVSFDGGLFRFEPYVSKGVTRFNWVQFSSFEHPTYLGIKTLWAISLVILINRDLKIKKPFNYLILLILSVFLFLLSVKANIIILAVLIISFLYTHFKSLIAKVLIILLIPVIFVLSYLATNLNLRMSQEIMDLRGRVTSGVTDWKNFNPRTRSWSSSIKLIRENPVFGVGLGSRDKLTEEYRKQGYIPEADLRLNAHNQYLETQLAFGIIGTALLFWMLFAPLVVRKRFLFPGLIIPFVIIISISMLFESILMRQWGIMFFVLFYCILTIPERVTDIS
jgi:O-antigen ligase